MSRRLNPFAETNIVEKLSEWAAQSPDKAYCKILGNDWRLVGPRILTVSDIDRAVNRLCFWLDEQFGKSANFDQFIFTCDNDIRYGIVVIAAAKSQRTVILPDAAAKRENLQHVVDTFQCRDWVASPSTLPVPRSILDQRQDPRIREVPSLEELVSIESEEGDKVYPYSKTWDEIIWDPVFVIQTSGTTGLPKSTTYTHAMISLGNKHHELPGGGFAHAHLQSASLRGQSIFWPGKAIMISGIIGMTTFPLFSKGLPIFLNARDALSADVVADVIKVAQPDGIFMITKIIRDMVVNEAHFSLLQSLKLVGFTGMPLDHWIGDKLSQHVQLFPLVGTTETSSIPLVQHKDPLDWKYYEFATINGHRMDPVLGADGTQTELFELVFDRIPELTAYQGAFLTFPDRSEYRTLDLYKAVPGKPDKWQYEGRRENLDLIAWQQQTQARNIESIVGRNPRVQGVIVGGESVDVPFMVVELVDRGTQDAHGIESLVSDLVRAIDSELPASCRISQHRIIVADEQRPFKRNLNKATIDRPGTLGLYQYELAIMS